MNRRKLGPFSVSAVGLGCMGLSHGYGIRPERADAQRVLLDGLEMGYDHFDTATIYGTGHNEELLGETIMHRRNDFTLASKCGLYPGPDGKRDIDGTPARIFQACEDSLRRLKTDHIDLYYLHRLDKNTPIEDSIGALSELVSQGKIGAIGVSEVSADTLRRAHAVHPIAAIQTEYSLWTRNAEIGVFKACQDLGITFVAFSPLARGFLSGKLGLSEVENFTPKDLRRSMPRFSDENYPRNLALLPAFEAHAADIGCTPVQLALAWIFTKFDNIIAIPGTTSCDHLTENFGAQNVELDAELVSKLDEIIGQTNVAGPRYTAQQQPDIDTEQFAVS